MYYSIAICPVCKMYYPIMTCPMCRTKTITLREYDGLFEDSFNVFRPFLFDSGLQSTSSSRSESAFISMFMIFGVVPL